MPHEVISLDFLFVFAALVAAATIVTAIWLWRRPRLKAKIQGTLAEGPALPWLKTLPETIPQHIEFEGEKVHFIQAGKGPDIVLIHGIGASIYTWRFLIPKLAENYRVTALDLPGFGKSLKLANGDYGLDAQRKRVQRFLSQLDIKRAYLVGSSMGGAIALWMAHENPERFPMVAALAPATSPELIPSGLSKAVARAPLTHKTLNRWTMRMILKQVVAKPELITSESIEAYLEPFMDQGLSVKTFLGAMQLLGDRRMPNCFTGIQSKVLLIQGEKDRMVTLRSTQRLHKIIPKAELVVSRTGGHHIMEDEPEWTLTHLQNFFSKES